MRSVASGRVVYRSRGNPENSRPGRLQHGEVLHAAGDMRRAVDLLHGRQPGALTLAHERVVVRHAVDEDALPLVLLGLPEAALDPVEGRHEVVAELQQVLLGGGDAVLLREGERGVLLRVGGDDHRVVALEERARRAPLPAAAT